MRKKQAIEILIVCACILLLSVPNAFATCYPPPNNSWCEGNFNHDCDVDGSDASQFKSDFGRSGFNDSCPPSGPAMVPRTGMVNSWFPYDDGSTQCGIESPNPRFTNNGDGTVTDNLTGLTWLKDAGCLTETQTCSQLLVDCNMLNTGECGLTDGSLEGDWRLPTIRELLSIVDFGKAAPATPDGMFNNVDSGCDGYCHSTPYFYDKDYILIIHLWYGSLYYKIGSANFGAVCVKTTHPYCPGTVTTAPTTVPTTSSSSTSTTVPSTTEIHMSYIDGINRHLRYAHLTASSGSTEVVDSSGTVGDSCSIAVDSSGYAHIAYYETSNDDLKYARWNGSSWEIETVAAQGVVRHDISIALDSSGYAHIAFFEDTYDDLKYAHWNGSSWVVDTVDDGEVGWYHSMALDNNGYAHISYYDVTNDVIKYARWNGYSWGVTTVDSAGADVFAGYPTSIALDSSGYPHISYNRDAGLDTVNYARWNGSSWIKEVIHTTDKHIIGTSLALCDSGAAYIIYYTLESAEWPFPPYTTLTYVVDNYLFREDMNWNLLWISVFPKFFHPHGDPICDPSSTLHIPAATPGSFAYYISEPMEVMYVWGAGDDWNCRTVDELPQSVAGVDLAIAPQGE